MGTAQITLRTLLEDPIFSRWVDRIPELQFADRYAEPWRVIFQHEEGGAWAIEKFAKYKKGLKFVKKHLDDFYDMALSCSAEAARPPVVKVKGSDRRVYYEPPVVKAHAQAAPKPTHAHLWCSYCRRWTLFLWYRNHHAMPQNLRFGTAGHRSCKICGVSLQFNETSIRQVR